jgi:hypothetical protein
VHAGGHEECRRAGLEISSGDKAMVTGMSASGGAARRAQRFVPKTTGEKNNLASRGNAMEGRGKSGAKLPRTAWIERRGTNRERVVATGTPGEDAGTKPTRYAERGASVAAHREESTRKMIRLMRCRINSSGEWRARAARRIDRTEVRRGERCESRYAALRRERSRCGRMARSGRHMLFLGREKLSVLGRLLVGKRGAGGARRDPRRDGPRGRDQDSACEIRGEPERTCEARSISMGPVQGG